MDGYLERFRNGKRAERFKVLSNVCVKLKRLQAPNAEVGDKLWSLRKKVSLLISLTFMLNFATQQVKNWFNNNGRKRNARAAYTNGRKWSAERVVGQLYKEEVVAMTATLSCAKGGETAFIRKYWAACKAVHAALSAEKRAEVQRLINEWSNTGPPMEIRRKSVIPLSCVLHS